MMASQEQVELINQILPLLVTQPSTLGKHEVVAILRAISKCEKIILSASEDASSEAEATSFFAPTIALTTHCIMSYASQIPKSQLAMASSACHVILQYLLHTISNYNENSILTKHQLISLMQGLCEDVPPLLKSDIVSLCLMLKSASLPSVFVLKQTLKDQAKSADSSKGGASKVSHSLISGLEESSSSKDSKRMRLDHTCEAMIEQLLTPVMDTPFSAKKDEGHDKNIMSSIGFNVSLGNDIKSLLINKNLINLQQLGGTNILLEFIMSLSSIESYIHLVHATEEGAPLKLPNNPNDASAIIKSCKALIKDYDIIWRILSLPILEPLTEDRLSKVITIIHACLYISLTLTCSNILTCSAHSSSSSSSSTAVKAASVKEDQEGEVAVVSEIVDTSLEIYKRIMKVMKSSNRVGGQICQNVQLFASWLLLSGLKYILKTSGSTTSITSKDSTKLDVSFKKQGYNQLCISLASHAVQLLGSLFDDLKSELSLGSSQRFTSAEKLSSSNSASSSSFKYNKFGFYSAWQRIEMLMSNINLTNLLFSLSSVSYRKAGLLKLVSTTRQNSNEHEIPSASLGATGHIHDIDDESCFSSDDSSRDEDSEPILGQLFKEHDEKKDGSEKSSSSKSNRQMVEVVCSDGDKREPHRHLALSTNIFELLNNYFVYSDIEALRHYFKVTISETQVSILAHIIKDLDRESSYNYSFYAEFTRALTSFMHNLIATEVLADQLQTYLMASLGVNPSDSTWPLYVPSRALSVLSQVILLKQQKEKEELRNDSGSSCLSIWNSLMAHLKKLIISEEPASELEDINVEHAQLLLFLFHNLKLLQRKSVLLSVAQTIVEVSSVVKTSMMKDHQIHYLARLVHFFEYMLKNLYEAPSFLVEQIDNNIFRSSSLCITPRRDKDNNITNNISTGGKMYFHCDIEDVYQRTSSSLDQKIFTTSIKPKYYYLLNVDAFNSKEVPKLDGMSLNFILTGFQDSLNYDDFYDSILQLLYLGQQCDRENRNLNEKNSLGQFGLSSTKYAFNTIWRLFLQLPPSVKCLEVLSSGDIKQVDYAKALVVSFWVPRIRHHKYYYIWIKDALSKLLPSDSAIKSEAMLKNVCLASGSLMFSVQLLKKMMNEVIDKIKPTSSSPNQNLDRISLEMIPSMFDVFILDSLMMRTLIAVHCNRNVNLKLHESCQTLPESIDGSLAKLASSELLPLVLDLIKLTLSCVRWSLIHQMCSEDSQQGIITIPKLLNAYNSILRITSNKCPAKMSNFIINLSVYLPRNLLKLVDKWNSISIDHLKLAFEESSAVVPSESYLISIETNHFSSLSSFDSHGLLGLISNHNLKYLLNTTFKLSEELYQCGDNKLNERYIQVMLPLQLDKICESFVKYGKNELEQAFGAKETDSEGFMTALYVEALVHSYDLLINYSDRECCVEEKILIECLKFMEFLLDSNAGQSALERFFCEDDSKDIVSLLMSSSNESLSSLYSARVLKFFSKLFQQTEKNPDSISLIRLCTSLSKLSTISKQESILQTWLSKILFEKTTTDPSVIAENRLLLQSLTSYIVKENSAVDEDVGLAFLYALIPMGTTILSSSTPEVFGFSELMGILVTLAGAGSSVGHLELIKAVIGWFETCKKYLSQKDVLEKLEENIPSGRHQVMMESACFMLSYLTDILDSIELLNDNLERASSPGDGEGFTHGLNEDSDWIDELACGDDESLMEDSDEESLCNKLCTFTTTQKEFMNQHWYHCHTCKMVEGVGVCSICAKVCHKDHDVTYAKYGSFFCDCGAKEDASCQALTRRSPNVETNYSSSRDHYDSNLISSIRRRPSSPSLMDKNHGQSHDNKNDSLQTKHQLLARQLESNKNAITKLFAEMNVSWSIQSLLQYLMPAMVNSCVKNSSIGCSIRARKALQELHQLDKTIEFSDQLMVPTLGSQEGAFENVRMTYTGEQGQQIRQFISSHILRRVAMCALTGPYGKRQHLAVSHEKGKITLLQLSTLLKQADSSKKKLTLTRLASAPLPFTAISIAGNPCNEDYLAVSGLKDCHVLTFSPTGLVSGHLVIHAQLEAGNYIIKTVWLPGTQTQLALVTTDFVKVYDLSLDVNSPQFHFLLPSGKIRDITFVFSEDGQKHMLLMSSAGHIYCQVMSDESSASNGPFYVTTLLDIRHEDVRDINGHINGGGVSIYYSHTLQLLFFSYNHGKNFAAPMPAITQELSYLFSIEINTCTSSNGGASSNGSSSKSSSLPSSLQSLCQWTEVSGHAGLVLAMCQSSNNPIVMMVKPETIVIQEIKCLNMKAKITDMVALRHTTGNGEMRTTLILLCEDGSLRIYMASQDGTNYWLRPQLCSQSLPGMSALAKARRKASKHSGKQNRAISGASGLSGNTASSPQFPVDFFEHCTVLTDVDYGGPDVLTVYNTQQVKTRLNTTGMYVASTKTTGFGIEITNNDNSLVMVGVRIMIGSQDVSRVPSYIDVFGRQIQVFLTRSRWYDIPFTREESLNADKKIMIQFGPSSDPNSVTMVDSIKVYGKSKESFGWPDDASEADFATSANTIANSMPNNSGLQGTSYSIDLSNVSPIQSLSPLERLLSWSLDFLDGCFNLKTIPTEEELHQKKSLLDMAYQLLTLPYQPIVQQNIKSLLMTLHGNRNEYYNHRDLAMINYVIASLRDANINYELDGEAFFRLIAITRQIAAERPNNLIQFSEAYNLYESDESTSKDIGEDSGPYIELTTFDATSRTSGIESPSIDLPSSHSLVSFPHETVNTLEQQLEVPLIPHRSASVTFSDEVAIRNITYSDSTSKVSASFIMYLADTFWRLYYLRPINPLLTSISKGGLVYVEETVHSLVEVIHAFALADLSNVKITCQLYLKLLLCDDPLINFNAKQSIIKVLRPKNKKKRVYIPSPPQCETPGQLDQEQKAGSISHSVSLSESQHSDRQLGSNHGSLEVFPHDAPLLPQDADQEAQFEVIEALEQVGLEHDHDEVGAEAMIVGADGGFPPLLDLNGGDVDADDDAMVELAIALSLQDQQRHNQPDGAIGNVPQVPMPSAAATPQRSASLEDRGHYSDTTASAAASDDEGSTAATDGSTLRTSPANELQGNEGGSESGGSGVESIIGEASGRSSAYGEDIVHPTARSGQPIILMHTNDDIMMNHDDNDHDQIQNAHLHHLRLELLKEIIHSLDQVRDVGGVRSIPLMQVILMLTSDLDGEGDNDKAVLLSLLNSLLSELYESTQDTTVLVQRTATHEVKLIIMRLLSILMSRVRSSSSSSGKFSSSSGPPDMCVESSSAFCSTITATTLMNSTILDFCLQILIQLLDYWKNWKSEEISSSTSSSASAVTSTSTSTSSPLKPRPLLPPPEMSPFFLKQYVRGHAEDVFESYPQLLTEMMLRMPYQIKKISNALPSGTKHATANFSPVWCDYLCEYMMTNLTPYIRKQVRKLLSYICGSKDRYRQIRDFHSLESHIKEIKKICQSGGFSEHATSIQASASSTSSPLLSNMIVLSYDATISLIEHLKSCCEIASNRTTNWQQFCQQKDPTILPFFIHVSCLLDEGVSPIVLQLLQGALCPKQTTSSSMSSSVSVSSNIPIKSVNKLTVSERDSIDDEPLHVYLAQQLLKQIDIKLLSQFIECFLLESNSTSHRWAAHSLIYNIYKSFSHQQQELLLDILWSLWPLLPNYGRKSAQFVDLLGFFTLKVTCSEEKEREFAEKALSILRQQNQQLMKHPNCNLYNHLQSLVEFDGYFLESEPCLVCNNPEVNYMNMKLSSIKVDSRFTTTTQIVKLVGSHTISKITLRISDIKRSKMVKTLNIYYNNRAVHSVVELKNRAAVWHKARKCVLAAGQTELKIDFPLPIVACNLMIEYAEFYENIQASSETLQCPRCSASVPANPGVCSNCGENVFQCHKCRAINYDEKDPFLCNSCGFCKYAKFDYTLTAKPTCAVDHIENDDDRKKTVTSINILLEKADRVYKNLIANKPALEFLLLRIQEHGMTDRFDDAFLAVAASMTNQGASSSSSVHVNRAIQQLAQRYCSECKNTFDELSKIIQKVLASRKELVDYDNRQREKSTTGPYGSGNVKSPLTSRRDSRPLTGMSSFGCYGCASATVEHCITLLKALAMLPRYRSLLCSHGLLRELVDYNLRNGSINVRQEVRQLLCSLTKDNFRATADLNNLLMDKISVALKSRSGVAMDLSSSVRHEIALLATSMEKEDSCWEQRLRCVMQLFLMGLQIDSPSVLESITLPCLKLLQSLIKPEQAISKKNKDKSIDQLSTVKVSGYQVNVDLNRWLAGDPRHSSRSWKARCTKKASSPPISVDQTEPNAKMKSKTKVEVRALYLSEKYAAKWREKVQKQHKLSLNLSQSSWLRNILFNGASRSVRLMACSLIEALFQIPSRKKEIIDLLTSYLDDLGQAGEFAVDFFHFYHSIIQEGHWKFYLALKGLLPHLGDLITREIDHLNQLEETTLNSDLSQGCALKMLVELLTSLMEMETIRQHYKSRMVGFVLNGYLSLRKLVVQRTKVIDETQEALLELLEEMTTGTEKETCAFMKVCVDAVKQCKLDDFRTPVFIFERLCSIIYPEENDTSEFFITLEKDPQQDDFLQGRMLGNPYSSNEPGMGPLMRDIKNKICQDCELVALLEDDSGLELLVNNKIISLDLSVKEVFRKIWTSDSSGHASHDSSEAMRIVYRIRGLMGDATEEFIESLDSKDNKEVDNEVVYKMANVMSTCGGLEVMLQRLQLIGDVSSRTRSFMLVLLKLFNHCVKVKSNRERLVDSSLKSIEIMLNILKLILNSENADLESTPTGPGQGSPLEQLIVIMETILVEASLSPASSWDKFCALTCGNVDDISTLLTLTAKSQLIRSKAGLMQVLMRIIPFLTYGHDLKMSTLLNFFKPYLVFNKFDFEHTPEDDHHVELFCLLSFGVEKNENGNRLKEVIVENGIVQSALEYLVLHAPLMKTSLLATSEEWKEFTSRPALKYVLRLLTGLSYSHDTTQLLVSRDCIPIIHGLEQVASDSHVGSLAENLMEAIKKHPSVQEKIEEVRRQTRDEKKRLAMAVREKQLAGLGMRTNEKGQVTAQSTLLKQVEDLGEEAGLVCIICREGYKFQPTKVLGIYTFTKRCNVDDYEMKPRRTLGYTTVTHFNIVHVDCHMSAVRHASGRDEWESAALQNANTRCNGLLPLWGPQVQESAFASCLARHNSYLQECTGQRDVSYSSTIHDVKLLILRFAGEKSFSDDSGGGGAQSNMHLIPYMLHMALYVLNTTRSFSKEQKKINNFLEMPTSKWIENCFESESPFYWLSMSLIINSPSVWSKVKLQFLRRLIVCSHVRHKKEMFSLSSATSGSATGFSFTSLLDDPSPCDYSVYKTSLVFFAFIDSLYSKMLKVTQTSDDSLNWALTLADFIRNNDQALLDSGVKILRFHEEDLLPCQSFSEFCDVAELLQEIPQPDNYITSCLTIK